MHLNFEVKTGVFQKIVSSVLAVSGFAASAVATSVEPLRGLRAEAPHAFILFALLCCWA